MNYEKSGDRSILCYVGAGEFDKAISLLRPLSSTRNDAAVQNLLAQAYIGNNQGQEGLAALRRAAELTPENEKLYALVADACADHEQYALGLQVIDLGLPADEASEAERQMARVRRSCGQGWKFPLSHPVVAHLEEPLRRGHVTQAVDTPINHLNAGSQVAPYQAGGRFGAKDLPSMAGRQDLPRALEDRAIVTPFQTLDVARVERHPNTVAGRSHDPLEGDRAVERIAGALERREEPISPDLQLGTAVLPQRRAKQRGEFGQGLSGRLSPALRRGRQAFEVR